NTTSEPGSDDFTGLLYIGQRGNGSDEMDGYIDEMRVSKGVIRSTSTFSVPTEPFTADTNTLLLVQSDWSEGELGADHSGNYNKFALTSIGANDSLLDSPTNNFCTFNPLSKGVAGTKGANIAMTEGNLEIKGTYAGWEECGATQYVSSGKWYAECLVLGNYLQFGVVASEHAMPQWTTLGQASPYGWALYLMASNNAVYHNNTTSSSTGSGFTSGDIWGLVLDLDAATPTLTWYKNNVSDRTTDGLTGYELSAGLT
ncbi:MAG: hypothetical protein VX237_04990, partial [Chloroflexota bacterium]|nr:hypothetical protein [Chloroflexota bacterium]